MEHSCGVRAPWLYAGLLAVLVAGCGAGPAKPASAEFRTGPPPWDAPRDAVSYVDAAGLERLPLGYRGPAPYTIRLTVTVDGAKVVVPANVGIDRLRAEQASLHTHTGDGTVYVEPKSRDDRPTLKQFFMLWGVRYDARCLGDACGGVQVLVDGEKAAWNTPIRHEAAIIVAARH
jgi:hypothetical protein